MKTKADSTVDTAPYDYGNSIICSVSITSSVSFTPMFGQDSYAVSEYYDEAVALLKELGLRKSKKRLAAVCRTILEHAADRYE